ncbi:hypothetical protein [Fulvivirga sp.]|uniref:hypothetical protein n=1 Tax=Fulvivirga sp. TaxID=1931237 RepID=UPI0032EB5A9E
MNFSMLFIFISSCFTMISGAEEPEFADVKKVEVQGSENAYQFAVTLKSLDTGCDQYADWWEVVSEDGNLIYRRILAHSHVDEQPFTRSGGSVNITKNQQVWVRAHMNNAGYGGLVMKGSVEAGFQITPWPDGFAEGIEKVEPLPAGCAF